MIDLIQKSIEAESKRLSECEGQQRQYMSGGGLIFLVEWWEKEVCFLLKMLTFFSFLQMVPIWIFCCTVLLRKD